MELIGAPAPEGTAEVIEVLSAALDAAGLTRAVVGLGDADLYRQLLAEFGIEGELRDRILDRLAAHDLVGLEPAVDLVKGLDADGASNPARAARACAAARRSSSAPRSSAARPCERATPATARDIRRARRSRASPIASGSTWACCATSATTPGRSSRSMTRRSDTSSAAAADTTR